MAFTKRYLVICLILIAGLTPALADEYFPETTSFEIALLYHKMIGVTPDFTQLAKQSPVYIEAPEIGKDIILEDQEKHLEMLFYTLSKNKPIAIIDNLSATRHEEDGKEIYTLSEMDESLHYIYDLAGNAYIIFVRNASELKNLYKLSNRQRAEMQKIVNSKVKVGAEIVLKPVAADVTPVNYQNEEMHMILADISVLRLIDNSNGDEIIEYTPIKERPELSKMERFFNQIIESRKRNPWDNAKD